MKVEPEQAVSVERLKEQARTIRSRMPAEGLFAGQEWRIAPAPFPLEAETRKEIESFGRMFLQFYKALNLLYRQSVTGRMPAWIAQWLDMGKPAELLDLQRDAAFKNDVPRVIRPDLLLGEEGLVVSELDSVPGGIGLTAWMNAVYSEVCTEQPVIGGPKGMLEGFEGIFGQASRVEIVISEEAASYRPEMEWISQQLTPGRFVVRDTEHADFPDGNAVYRFFELFDLPNVRSSSQIFARAREKKIVLTPPPKPIFEEKMAMALLWNRNLAEFWRRELGEGFFRRIQKLTPYTWVVDPQPLPPHGAIPGLNLTDWQQLKGLSQRERELILKISGYSEHAWGARGVHLGSDLSQAEWSAAVDHALQSFAQSPYILQRYVKPRLVDFAWHDVARDELAPMKGRVRLCPYYFVHGEGDSARPQLGGILATVCPEDKKIIHGMRDAILAPCSG